MVHIQGNGLVPSVPAEMVIWGSTEVQSGQNWPEMGCNVKKSDLYPFECTLGVCLLQYWTCALSVVGLEVPVQRQ